LPSSEATMIEKSLPELASALRAGEFSSVELTLFYLHRIKQHEDLNAFITVDADRALDQAKAADERIARREATPLTGIPIAHKDIFCTKGMLTTCGSKMLSEFESPYDAAVVEKLDRAGAVMLGKTNMDEFAMGSSNETSFFGPVRNPWDTSRVPGGSSGGSAAAVSARLVPAATGTDTGGSIRQPAAFDRLRLVAGSGWPHNPKRGRCNLVAAGNVWFRSSGFHICGSTGPKLSG